MHAFTAGNTTAAQPALQNVGIPFLHDSLGSLQHSCVTLALIVCNSFCVEHGGVSLNGAGIGAGVGGGACCPTCCRDMHCSENAARFWWCTFKNCSQASANGFQINAQVVSHLIGIPLLQSEGFAQQASWSFGLKAVICSSQDLAGPCDKAAGSRASKMANRAMAAQDPRCAATIEAPKCVARAARRRNARRRRATTHRRQRLGSTAV